MQRRATPSTVLTGLLAVLALFLAGCPSPIGPDPDSADALAVAADTAALELSFTAGDAEGSVTQNVTLPTSGASGSTISWSSSDPGIVSNSGEVSRPETNTDVTLTATITKGSESDTKLFTLTVVGDPVPSWASTYPKTGTLGETQALLEMKTNRTGKVYWKSYTSAQVLTPAGLKAAGTAVDVTAGTEASTVVTGLTVSTDYWVYLVAESTTALQDSVTELTFSTPAFTVTNVWDSSASFNVNRQGFHVNGSWLYADKDSSGMTYFTIWDVSDPTTPVEKTASAVCQQWYGQTIISSTDNSTLYLPDGTTTLRGVYDVTDKTAPVKVAGQTILGSESFGAAVEGDIYVAIRQSSGFYVYDISTPAAPVQKAEVTGMGYPYSISISGSIVAVADLNNGLYIYDISDPTAPALRNHSSTYGYEAVFVRGSILYAERDDSPYALEIFDISDPTAPVLLKGGIPFSGFGLFADSTYLYLGRDSSGVDIYNIEDPRNPVLVKHFSAGGRHAKVMAQAGYLYLAREGNSLMIYRLTGF